MKTPLKVALVLQGFAAILAMMAGAIQIGVAHSGIEDPGVPGIVWVLLMGAVSLSLVLLGFALGVHAERIEWNKLISAGIIPTPGKGGLK